MKTGQRILIGGIGALMPIIVNLLIVDFEKLADYNFLRTFGYLIKTLVLFGLGGLIAYFNKDEVNAFKLFQLGLGAPALIVGMLNGVTVKSTTPSSGGQPSSFLSVFVGTAYAQPPVAKKFSLPDQSAGEQIWQGITGQSPEKVWFVISGAFPSLKEAQTSVNFIINSGKGFTAEVYAPYKDNHYFSVVIGANLNYDQANELKQKALLKGLTKDTYLWKLK
jgi:hypothetical protein